MEYRDEINTFEELKKTSWSGALWTLEKVEEADKEEELMEFLTEVFCGEEYLPTRTQINDFLWFDADFIFESLGLNEDGELEEEEDE